jgi:hypothetical protein
MQKKIMRHNYSANNSYSSKDTFRAATSATWNEETFDDFNLWRRIVNVLME